MKSILIGFSDAAGRGDPKVVCGPEISDAKQAKVFLDAKRKQHYPKGLARLEWCFIDETRREIAISIPSPASQADQ